MKFYIILSINFSSEIKLFKEIAGEHIKFEQQTSDGGSRWTLQSFMLISDFYKILDQLDQNSVKYDLVYE